MTTFTCTDRLVYIFPLTNKSKQEIYFELWLGYREFQGFFSFKVIVPVVRGRRQGGQLPPYLKKKILYSIAIHNTCHIDLKHSILKEQITLFCLYPIGSFIFLNKTMFVVPPKNYIPFFPAACPFLSDSKFFSPVVTLSHSYLLWISVST